MMVVTHLTQAPFELEDAARAVFQVLEKPVAWGEISDVIQDLPQEIPTLWPGAQPRGGGGYYVTRRNLDADR